MPKSGIEYLAQHPGWKTKPRKPKGTIEQLDASDVATILSALRLFQGYYQDHDAHSIADAWPMHFNVQGEGDESVVVPEPLGSEDIDALCERINCGKVFHICKD